MKLGNEILKTQLLVERWLRYRISRTVNTPRELNSVLLYALPDIGLRIRPFLVRISYEQGSRRFSDILPIAAAIELVQISTLVIDDVLDESPLRNGKASVCAKWGRNVAITAGNVLFSEGFHVLSEFLTHGEQLKNRIAVITLLQKMHADVYVGQFTDVWLQGNIAVIEADYLWMISQTTASFIQAALITGALLRGASAHVISALKIAGLNLGLAYQIRDDVIDVIGDTECTGKPTAGDIRGRKMRLPVIHALSSLDKKRRKELAALLRSKQQLNGSEVREATELVQHAGSVDYAMDRTRQFCENAIKCIRTLGHGEKVLADRLVAVADLISCFDCANNK